MRPGHAFGRPVVVLAIGAALLLSGCSRSSESELAKAKAAGASEEVAKQKEKSLLDEQQRLAAEVKKLQEDAAKAKTQSTTPSPAAASRGVPTPRPAAGGASCGGNLSVGGNTSCAFAANVESAFYAAGGGTSTIEVYSPVTGRYYAMRCVSGIPTVCRGGNNAVVYIR